MKNKSIILLIIIGLLFSKNVYAETYDGEYSLEYLLRNYNVVTLGNKAAIGIYGGASYIYGPVLINGNYSVNGTFGSEGNIKSYISGTKNNNANTEFGLVQDTNYIDFNKLYTHVMNESQILAEKTEYHINSAKLEISKPGNYTIHDSGYIKKNNSNSNNNNSPKLNGIVIRNYDKNKYYIFNYYNEFVQFLPQVYIIEEGATSPISIYELANSGKYNGNIIFNFPNARQVLIPSYLDDTYNLTLFIGNIVAPKANIYYTRNLFTFSSFVDYNCIGTIIANDIYVEPAYNLYTIKSNMTNEKLINQEVSDYIEETKDYTDDAYLRDYSISDLLQNYSLITLGHKEIDSKSKLLEYGNKPGSVRLFHITGQTLINGDLYGKKYENEPDSYYTTLQKFDRTAFDLESNKVCESYIDGKITQNIKQLTADYTYNISMSVIQPWDNMSNDNYSIMYKKNTLFIKGRNNSVSSSGYGYNNYSYLSEYLFGNTDYINFDRLYNNIVSEQQQIKEGDKITSNGGKAHIKIGGSYVIDDINDINEVIFDNFDDNKNKITVITVKNSGDINFPLISRDTGSYKGIVTNDYFGKEQATHLYEENTFISEDSYYGNIVWNIPNATYIKLKEGVPFAGHMIAPKADVDTPELHFAGCFIVNSIYGEGNTEAHFYPLTATATYDVPEYDDLTPTQKSRLAAKRLDRLLGGSGSEIETTILGDEEQYRQDENYYNNLINQEEQNKGNTGGIISPIIESLKTNPKTLSTIGIIISLLTMIGLSLYVTLKCKKNI